MEFPSRGQRTDHGRALSVRVLVALTLVAGLGACATDPVYLDSNPPTMAFEPGADLGDAGVAGLVLTVPIALETPDDTAVRTEIAAEIGLAPEQVPTVRREDTDLAIEWTITNLEDADGLARLAVIGANEFFRYDPLVFVDPTDEEAEPPPPLMGGKPIMLPAGATVSGVLREDELYEAAQDLDAISRGGVVPEMALFTRWKTPDVEGGMGGVLETIPSRAIPLLLQLSMTVDANVRAELRATLRVRDRSDRLRPTEQDLLLLVPPSATVFTPPAPVP